MSFDIQIGSWILPLTFMIALAVICWGFTPTPKPGGYYPDFGAGIMGAFLTLLWVIGTLAGWLLWALLH